MSKIPCTYESFFKSNLTTAAQCQLSRGTCAGSQSLINFFSLLYCDLNGLLGIYLVIAFITLLLIFRFISATIEEYVAPAITYISDYLKLSEALAAVTLIALANGAGDVITALVASDSEGGISYNIGSLYGAGLFVCSFVVAFSIFGSKKKILVNEDTIYRDIAMYIFATLLTMAFALYGYLTWWTSVIMLLAYVVLVIIVLIQDHLEKKKRENRKGKIENQLEEHLLGKEKTTTFDAKNMWKKAGFQVMKNNSKNKRPKIQHLMHTFRLAGLLMLRIKKRHELNEKSFWERSLYEKILYIVDFPFEWARKLTMPPCEEDSYDKRLTYAWPFTGVLFFIFAFLKTPSMLWVYIGVPVCIASFLFFFLTQKDAPNDQVPKYFILITLIGAIGGLLWTYVMSSILIDMLNMLGVIAKLEPSFLGLTIIAVGNALPDALTTIALAKQGKANLGLAGGYAGQLFGLLVGFGLAMLKKCLLEGPQVFDLFSKPKENVLDIIVVFVALLVLGLTFIYSVCRRFKYDRLLAVIMIGIYVGFIVIATAVQIVIIIKGKI